MGSKSRIAKQVLSLYFIAGGVISLCIFFSQMGFLGYLVYLLPATAIVIIELLIIAGGIAYLRDPGSKTAIALLNVGLIVQTIQFTVFGFTFINYFGPSIITAVWIEPTLRFFFELNPIAALSTIGYEAGREDMMIGVNWLPVLFALVIYILEKDEEE